MHKPKLILIPILFAVILLSLGIWYLIQRNGSGLNNKIEASGTIEATEVIISPELGGRVAEVMVDKGQYVEAGTPLLRLDDELLQSQRKRAVMALESAQANLVAAETSVDLAREAQHTAEVNLEVARASAEAELLPAKTALEDLYENVEVARALALKAVAAASRAVREAQYRLDNFTVPTNQRDMTALEAVAVMKERLDKARADFEPYKYEPSGNPTRDELKEALDEAQSNYDAAVRRLEYETDLKQAEAALDKALRDLEALKDGPNPDDVAALQARIKAIEIAPNQAEAALEQAKEGVKQAEARLEQASKAVEQAQAELDLIDVQIKKLVVYAPISGVVLSRSIEAGEVVQAGAELMTIGDLSELRIRVFIPEDRYGQIKLGDEAEVTVDSFPNQTFVAKVVHIADKAEFTPRNVQTVEGRRTTVFAVELEIDNSDGALKPGMPVDLAFRP